MKRKNKLKMLLSNLWFIKLFKELSRDKSICKECNKNSIETENFNGVCFDCFYRKGIKENK